MVFDSGVHFSLHPNSHHLIVFAKFNLKVYYPPPYEKHIWHYKYAHTVQIKNALASFNWEQALSNSSIDKKISILNETIINVMSNYIPNKIKVFDDQKQLDECENWEFNYRKKCVLKWVFITKACTHLHPASPSSIHLYPAHFSVQLALCNTLNVSRTKMSHVIGQLPQI